MTRDIGAFQFNAAVRSPGSPTTEDTTVPSDDGDSVLAESPELALPPEEPPPQPVRMTPVNNAAIHAFDILLTRFMIYTHHYFVVFVKLYKTWASIGVIGLIFLITKWSIFRHL
ncbi:MAG: hypothetical protein ACPHQ9_03620 [Marinobacter sp.]|uniref:hypothetical protein n=1 Tax=Marinobacter sp. TaxID=50741 RepID=UPI001B1924AB|nr:hypothetical protein [Marinobacter sp.]